MLSGKEKLGFVTTIAGLMLMPIGIRGYIAIWTGSSWNFTNSIEAHFALVLVALGVGLFITD